MTLQLNASMPEIRVFTSTETAPQINSTRIEATRDKDNQLHIVAYKNGKKLDQQAATKLYEDMQQQQKIMNDQWRAQWKLMQQQTEALSQLQMRMDKMMSEQFDSLEK